MKFKQVEEIASAIQPIAERLNVEIIEIETKVNKSPYITLYIDCDSGVDLNICEAFHNAIDPVLDEIDVSNGSAYTLNVSSPGVDRPLKTERDFKKRIGKDVEIKLFAPMQGEKYFESKLIDFDGNNVTVILKNKEFKIPLNKIAKINEAVKF